VSFILAVEMRTSDTNGDKNRPENRPNIVFILTDDQDTILGGTDFMPHLQRHIIEQGMAFTNAFVHTPVCCPSRSSIWSGRYLHNGGAINNSISGNCYGPEWQKLEVRDTLAIHLKKAGYQTSYSGKYLNQYGTPSASHPKRVPPGWSHWLGLVGNSCYYNYSIIRSDDDGKTCQVETHGVDYETDYLPNVILNRSLAFLESMETTTSTTTTTTPFFMVLAYPSPHAPFTPEPKYQNLIPNKAKQTPNYNASAISLETKHWMMRFLPIINTTIEEFIDEIYRRRLETLLTVDEHVGILVQRLETLGLLNSTYILYASDNGYQLGQHRLRADKRQLYEHDIRVPLYVRGPNIPANSTCPEMVLNIDWAPTILDLVGSPPSTMERMDGETFAHYLHPHRSQSTGPDCPREDFLLSYHGEWFDIPTTLDFPNNTYHCVRTRRRRRTRSDGTKSSCSSDSASDLQNDIYCRFEDDERFVEYYDMTADEWQLENRFHELSIQRIWEFEKRLAELRHCRGSSCRRRFCPNENAF
jgi:N-acetylglucosamine-6-sulfatase